MNFLTESIYVVLDGVKTIEKNKSTTVRFFVYDVANIASIEKVEYSIYTKDGRTETVVTPFTLVQLDDNYANVQVTATAVGTLFFRFKVTTEEAEYIINVFEHVTVVGA